MTTAEESRHGLAAVPLSLEQINAVDVQLYAFIERFLDARLRACGVGADARAR